MKKWWNILVDAGKNWASDNAFKHAASVSFYTLFSLAPITIIAVSIAGAFYGEEAAQGELAQQLSELIGEEGAAVVEKAVAESQLEASGLFSTILGVTILIIGATTVFAQLQESLNQIWCVEAKPDRSSVVVLLMRRLLSFALVLTIGFLLLVSLVLSTVLTAAVRMAEHMIPMSPVALRGVDLTVSLGVITVLFAMIFKVLPDVYLRWRDVWKGAFVTALLFSGGRYLISLYLGHSTLTSTYGAAGSLVAVLLWVYYSCLILFFGVEFTRAYLHANDVKIRPKSKAIRVRRVVVEEPKNTSA